MSAIIHEYQAGTLDFLLEECEVGKSSHLYDESPFPFGRLDLPEFVDYRYDCIGWPTYLWLTFIRKSDGSRRYVFFVRNNEVHDDKWIVLFQPTRWGNDFIHLGTIHAVNIRGQRLKTSRGMWQKYLRDLKKV